MASTAIGNRLQDRHHTAACAAEAARRSGDRVAWVMPTSGFERVRMVVLHDVAFEEPLTEEMLASLESDPQRLPFNPGPAVRTIDHAGIELELHSSTEGGIQDAIATWTSDGHAYRIVVTSLATGQRLDLDAVTKLIQEIRYADPAPSAPASA